jgi:putative hydrolase of the HAD superfamily
MKKPAIIFDFGNVVAFFDYALACDRLARQVGLGISGRDLLARMPAPEFKDLVIEYESGRIPCDDFADRLLGAIGVEASREVFRGAWEDIFWLNGPVARVIRELDEAGYRLVLGSNTNRLHADHYLAKFAEVLGRFDGVVLSYQVGEMKPSPVFYGACTQAAGLPASECVFIDDLAENVAGARSAGLRGIHYIGDDLALRTQLGAEGVEIRQDLPAE